MPFGAIAAAIAPAAIGAIGSAIGGGGQSQAVQQGSQQAQELDDQARQTGQTNYANDQANAQPFIAQGQAGANALGNILGLNGADASANALANFQASPGYNYQLSQGLRAVDAGAASNGLLRSGATAQAEQTLGSNLANQDFQNYLGNLNKLATVGTTGVTAANASTNTFDNLLTGTTADQTGVITGTAGQQASIYGNQVNGLGTAVGAGFNAAQKNGLFSTGTGGTDGFAGGGYPGLGTDAFAAGGW